MDLHLPSFVFGIGIGAVFLIAVVCLLFIFGPLGVVFTPSDDDEDDDLEAA